MAYLAATDLNDLQSLDATNEKRFYPLGLVDSAKDSTPGIREYIPPSKIAEMQKLSSARLMQIPVLKDQTVTVVSTPGFSFIPSNLPESAAYYFEAVDLFSGFRFYPASYEDNQIDMEWEKKERMKNILHAIGVEKEALIASTLEDRKTTLLDFTTQVSQGAGTYEFVAATDILQISKAAQKATMFFELEALMAANKLAGNYRVVVNPAGLAVQQSEALQYGAGNEKNLRARGFFGEDRMYQSHSISAGSDVFNGWLFRDGAIGLIENFPWDFRNGTEVSGRKWSVSDTEMPWTRSRVNVYVNTEAVEGTALVNSSNMKMTHFQEMAIWDRFYIVYRYNSDLATRANDVVKIKGLTTEPGI